ncbi:cupin domain-containing protein [Congregibacter sp.]|uniref:cupin domain-containing protein n=1 Tax=Congregibacter sp. TaxID=2744308 RepID=UPI003F6C5CCA
MISAFRTQDCKEPLAGILRIITLTWRTAPLLIVLSLAGFPVMADQTPLSAEELIKSLGLEGHVEGGFYRRTYEATDQPRLGSNADERFSMTSIFYLLTAEGPIGHFHQNRSDIVHYFHLGDPIEYVLIHPDGELETVVMGADPRKGQQLQLTVHGGVWKASRLTGGEQGFGLISEAVSPGFDYRDMTLGVTSTLLTKYPQHRAYIEALSRESSPDR